MKRGDEMPEGRQWPPDYRVTGLDIEKMERAADRFVALGTELGLNRKEMCSVAAAVYCNHAIATGVARDTARLTVAGMYQWRPKNIPERCLVADVPVVHILWEGLPLCRFMPGPPAVWPTGHKWVSLEDPLVLKDATCSHCVAEQATRKP